MMYLTAFLLFWVSAAASVGLATGSADFALAAWATIGALAAVIRSTVEDR